MQKRWAKIIKHLKNINNTKKIRKALDSFAKVWEEAMKQEENEKAVLQAKGW